MQSMYVDSKHIYYANITGDTEVVDSHGLYTGEHTLTYETPRKARVVPAYIGKQVALEQYGLTENFTCVITTHDTKLPIKAGTLIWLDRKPTEAHDYVVSELGRPTRNVLAFSVRKVNVNA